MERVGRPAGLGDWVGGGNCEGWVDGGNWRAAGNWEAG